MTVIIYVSMMRTVPLQYCILVHVMMDTYSVKMTKHLVLVSTEAIV